MKVYIKNKIVSIGAGSDVLDVNGQPIFKVKGNAVSFRRTKYICDMAGNVLYTVKNKLINLWKHRAFMYDAAGTKIATVSNKVFTVKKEFFVHGYKDEIKLEGNIFSLSSNILRNGQVIGTMRRQIEVMRGIIGADSFELEGSEEDMPFLIALIIAVDNICDNIQR